MNDADAILEWTAAIQAVYTMLEKVAVNNLLSEQLHQPGEKKVRKLSQQIAWDPQLNCCSQEKDELPAAVTNVPNGPKGVMNLETLEEEVIPSGTVGSHPNSSSISETEVDYQNSKEWNELRRAVIDGPVKKKPRLSERSLPITSNEETLKPCSAGYEEKKENLLIALNRKLTDEGKDYR